MSRLQDLACILKSLQLIAEACAKLQAENVSTIWKNSSLRYNLENIPKKSKANSNLQKASPPDIADSIERVRTVLHGMRMYTSVALSQKDSEFNNSGSLEDTLKKEFTGKAVKSKKVNEEVTYGVIEPKPIILKGPERIYKLELTDSDKDLLKRLDMEHKAKLIKEKDREDNKDVVNSSKTVQESSKITATPNPKSKQKLSDSAKQRKVPSSRIGRMVSFGTLAAGLGLGTAAEYAKRTLHIGETKDNQGMLFMNKANMDRIVDTLCKVRGAALKLGQIMSIQDESLIDPELAKALERVRKSADFMPDWQLEQVMASELGPNWRNNFESFDNTPFAAASIGQVHQAKLKSNGADVAIKVQYPGVSQGIESDIDNLGGIMKMWNIFPKGMFLENLMTVAKRELAWEVNYIREAVCTRKFKELLKPYDMYYVPEVIESLSTKQVFTTELLDGTPVDQCFDLDMEHKQFIGDAVMELCLLEILKFQYMQTDPNWANFLYNPNKKQLLLLDFGASREYSDTFIDQYVKILKAAYEGDRETVLNVSRDLGFLTGYESKIMEEAHIDAVMILGEVFRSDEPYNFEKQDMLLRIQDLAQTMLIHRLCPPPEEVYSLHRKLSGVFLLCSRLKVTVDCREKFLRLYAEYLKDKTKRNIVKA